MEYYTESDKPMKPENARVGMRVRTSVIRNEGTVIALPDKYGYWTVKLDNDFGTWNIPCRFLTPTTDEILAATLEALLRFEG